jgi:hypothetical protein
MRWSESIKISGRVKNGYKIRLVKMGYVGLSYVFSKKLFVGHKQRQGVLRTCIELVWAV